MSKEQINITENVMSQIRNNKVRMRPKWYFVAGSILTFIGIVGSMIVAVFLLNLTQFALRAHGPMKQFRLELILSSFPWWAPVLAVAGIVTGIYCLKRYDFSYKKNFLLILTGFIAAILLTAFVISSLKLDELWFRRGPMQGIMRQYLQNSEQSNPRFYQNQPGQGNRWGWR